MKKVFTPKQKAQVALEAIKGMKALNQLASEYEAHPIQVGLWKKPHSIEFSGGVGHRSSKASRREDLEIEQPVACWDFSSFHFHPTLASMLGATLIRYQVVEVR
jgi:hypothetical protein